MEFFKFGCLVPHPPIVVPEVGGAEVNRISDTVNSLKRLSGEIEDADPKTLIVISPHSPVYSDGFAVKGGNPLIGSLSMFRAADVQIEASPDYELIDAICEIAMFRGVPVTIVSSGKSYGRELDHGILVPLYYLFKERYSLVCITISLLDYKAHYVLGTVIKDAIEKTGHGCVFIASGDLSHRLTRNAPAGYDPDGAVFDRQIYDIMKASDFRALFHLDPTLVNNAGECGLRSIITMAGIFDGLEVEGEVMSYEGPFGVGYMVARCTPLNENPSRSISF
ncbi:MAG: MEMO1 family protein [Actinobacteria bacterium]|nr:MEMO1 family protein [Actinomycetota bacterium]